MPKYVWHFLKNSYFVATRFTKARQEEILSGFRLGKSFSILSKEFGCTPATVTRIVKSLISNDEFLEVKKARKKHSKSKSINSSTNFERKDNLSSELQEDFALSQDSIKEEYTDDSDLDSSIDEDLAESVPDFQQGEDQFPELIPLITDFEWKEQQEVACQPFSIELLPTTVFMLVDKTVELESKPLKDFSQWSFLPDKDQDRLAIVLYSNQRSAKRSCSRNQRVLKIPDSSIFQVTMSHLVSKGITRLILDDSLISIDD